MEQTIEAVAAVRYRYIYGYDTGRGLILSEAPGDFLDSDCDLRLAFDEDSLWVSDVKSERFAKLMRWPLYILVNGRVDVSCADGALDDAARIAACVQNNGRVYHWNPKEQIAARCDPNVGVARQYIVCGWWNGEPRAAIWTVTERAEPYTFRSSDVSAAELFIRGHVLGNVRRYDIRVKDPLGAMRSYIEYRHFMKSWRENA